MISTLKRSPVVRRLLKVVGEPSYRRRFSSDGYGCFWGVFQTFEEAIQAAPPTKPIGYDNPDLALEYQRLVETDEGWEGSSRKASLAQPYDYPVMLWLNSIFEAGLTDPTIFDFGGNVGIHYYAYEKYIRYPQNLVWTVCDLPAIAKAGQELAARRSRSNLVFTSDPAQMDGQDIFLASGSLHYLPDLSMFSVPRKPKHLFVNRIPVHDKPRFVTLQNGGKVFYPQHVFNRDELVDHFLQLGYELVDVWEERVTACMIPYYPNHSVPFCHGFYFKLDS